MSIIEFDAVSKRYGDITALDDVTVDLVKDRITGMLGRNGAGKSTFMQLATGRAMASTGTIRVFGEDPYENPRVLDRVCFIGENQTYPTNHKVRHALAAARIAFPRWDQSFADDLVGEFGLRTSQQVSKLSRGQRSAVGVVLGLASRAPLTFFDEPYLGLDAVARQLFYDRVLADYAEHPRTIVLSTHLIDEVSDLIEHVVVLDAGRVILDADAESLRGSAIVVSGPRAEVEAFAAGHDVLLREDLGGFARLTVRGADPDLARRRGLSLEPVSLQQLVVRSTPAAPPTPPSPPTPDSPALDKVAS